ncbi:hypothetical protein OA88_20485 [Flavobacterium sp. JRM]|nr:hypothetical protein OA88_20485 [Flavobacterium sp. JRM]
MLTSEKKLNHTLRIRISEEYKYFVNIILFDSNSRIIESQSSNRYEVLYALLQGLYTIRVEMNGNIKDEVILLDKEKEFEIGNKNSYTSGDIKIISPPKQFSSALLGENYGSSHEYYTYPAIDWSQKETFEFNPDNNALNSSLFIFLRFPSVERFDTFRNSFSKPFYSDFEIVDEYGSVLTQFEKKIGVEINEQQGWIAFNAKIPNGIYYLMYKGEEPRQIPIYIYKNWHTQFFMTLGNQPLFATTRIFLSRQREFNPNERTYKYIDILLDKIQNQDFILDIELISIAASGKYESPMLGLICSYIYLQSNETKNDNLFSIINQNMRNVILVNNEQSPDLRALDILAANHFPNYKYKKRSIKGTPMLRIGFEAILKASVESKSLIPQNSINDFISENIYFDSPFNTFKPIPFKKRPTIKLDKKDERLTESIEKINSIENIKNIESIQSIENIDDDFREILLREEMLIPKRIESIPKVDKFTANIKNLFDDNVFSYIQSINQPEMENSWIKSSISDILQSNNNISINDISKDLNVSGNTITRIFNDWKKEAKKQYRK